MMCHLSPGGVADNIFSVSARLVTRLVPRLVPRKFAHVLVPQNLVTRWCRAALVVFQGTNHRSPLPTRIFIFYPFLFQQIRERRIEIVGPLDAPTDRSIDV